MLLFLVDCFFKAGSSQFDYLLVHSFNSSFLEYVPVFVSFIVTTQVARFTVHHFTLFESIHACLCDGRQVPVAMPQYLQTVQSSSPPASRCEALRAGLSNLEPPALPALARQL
jgi:hypothetical protein